MNTLEAALYSPEGEAKGKVELPAALFQGDGSRHILQEVIVFLQGNQRRGTSETKTRSFVSGGGRKPWKQKGTGNARSGSIRSPLWRGGGIIFGPHPRSYRVEIDKQKKKVALLTALNEKAKISAINVVESFSCGDGKTGPVEKVLRKAGFRGRLLLVVDKRTDMLVRSVRNIADLDLADVRELNPLSVMLAKNVLFTQAAIQALADRFPKG